MGSFQAVKAYVTHQRASKCVERSMKVILETGDLLAMQVLIRLHPALYGRARTDYVRQVQVRRRLAPCTESVCYVSGYQDYYDKTGVQIGLKPAGHQYCHGCSNLLYHC